jgi:hypothetical protein
VTFSKTMEEIRSAMEKQVDLVADLVEKLSGELRTGFQPAYDNFLGFFHAIDWKEPWIMGLMAFHALLLLVTLLSRRHLNFHMFLFLLACKFPLKLSIYILYKKSLRSNDLTSLGCGIHSGSSV